MSLCEHACFVQRLYIAMNYTDGKLGPIGITFLPSSLGSIIFMFMLRLEFDILSAVVLVKEGS